MTADVPPGPARRAGIGIVMMARLSGRPIVPCAAATSRFRALNTWSRMTINLPGSKLAYVAGDPIWVAPDAGEAELEFARQQLERALNAVTARAYEIVGADVKRATPLNLEDPTAPPADPDFRLKAYRTGMSLLRPIAPLILKICQRSGKEDGRRRGERLGQANIARPNGVVVLGARGERRRDQRRAAPDRSAEQRSARPQFPADHRHRHFRGLAERRLGPSAVHQYVPLDAPEYAARFLDHWQPDLAMFTESEIWPSLILETAARNIPHRAGQRAPVAPQPPALAAQQVDRRPLFGPLRASCWRRTSAWRSASRRLAPATSCRSATSRSTPAAARRPQRAGAPQGRAWRTAGVRAASTHEGEESRSRPRTVR